MAMLLPMLGLLLLLVLMAMMMGMTMTLSVVDPLINRSR